MDELEKMIIDCVNGEIDLQDLRKYKNDFDEDLWEVEGLCVLMRTDVFKLVRDDDIFKVFIGTYSRSSDKVCDLLKNLIDLHLNELKNSKEGDWWEHEKMCLLLVEVVEKGEIGEIFEYIVTVVEVCEDDWTVRLTVYVFIAYPTSKVTCWLMQRLDWMMTQLDGEVVDWTGHRNVGELIWMMLRCVVGDGGDKHRKYYSNVLNQEVSDQILNYMMKLIDSEEHEQMKVMAITNLELLCVTNRVDRDGQDKFRLKLSKVAEIVESAALLPNQQFNSVAHQVGWCARWCSDNLWDEEGRVDQLPLVKLSLDRFEARNYIQFYSTVRSSFSVSNIYYYEVVLITQGEIRIGWSTRNGTFGWENGKYCIVGDDEHSIAFNVYHGDIVHNNIPHQITNLPAHQSPNVVGCLIDTHNRQFVFYLNGHKLDCLIDFHFSSSHYYATVSLGAHQQCQFNFGQSPFKFSPKDIQIKSFDKVTNGDVRKYRLAEIEKLNGIFWFKHSVVENQVDLFYQDTKQDECDQLVRQFELDIAKKKSTKSNLTQLECLRFIQSVIEVMQIKLLDDEYIREVLIKQTNRQYFIKWSERKIFYANLNELLYPYTQLQLNSENHTKCHNVCVIITSLRIIYPKCLIDEAFSFFITNHFIYISTFLRNPQKFIDAFAFFDQIQLKANSKRLLLNNRSFIFSLQWISELFGQLNQISRLYELTQSDMKRLQAGLCAKWLSDQVILDQVLYMNDQAILNPQDKTLNLKLSNDCLSVRNDHSSWQSIRSLCSVNSGIYYYEVILFTDGEMLIGWATNQTDWNKTKVGEDKFSVGFDGCNQSLYNVNPELNKNPIKLIMKSKWSPGDVVGCLIDFNNSKFTFYLNGKKLKYDNKSIYFFYFESYYAAASLSTRQQCFFNFGQSSFKYPPKDVTFRSFTKVQQPAESTNRELSKCYPTVEVFANARVELVFDNEKQKEIDRIAIKVEQDIFDRKVVKLNLVNGDDCLRLIQSVIEMMGMMNSDKMDLTANWIDHFIKESSQKLLHFPDLVCQVLYPYFSLNLANDTFTKHRNVCLVISALITTMKELKLRVNLYKVVVTYLTQIVTRSDEIEDQWMFMFAVIGLGNLDLSKEDIETLEANDKMCKILENYNNTPKHSIQSNFCSRWFYDKIFGKDTQLSPITNQTKLDINSATCHLKLSANCLSARSDWAWQSVRSTRAVSGHTFYFEVTLHTNGPIRIGWSTRRTHLKDVDMFVGSDEHSIAFDGYHRLIWHENKSYPVKSVPQWKVGDVVGCLIGNNQFSFSLNQQHIPTPSLVYFSSKAYFASVSLSSHQQCTFNFSQSKQPPRRTSFLHFDSVRSARNSFIKAKKCIKEGNIVNSVVLLGSKLVARNVFLKSITTQQQGSSTSKETSTNDTNFTEEDSEDAKFLEDDTLD